MHTLLKVAGPQFAVDGGLAAEQPAAALHLGIKGPLQITTSDTYTRELLTNTIFKKQRQPSLFVHLSLNLRGEVGEGCMLLHNCGGWI